MIKADLPENEEERLAALKQYNILDSLPEEDYDLITQIASQICQTPISLITLVDEDRQWFKSHRGLDINQTPRDIAYCAHALLNPEEPLIIPNALEDERFKDNPLAKGNLHVEFYAGVALVDADGYALGSLCVIDNQPRALDPTQLSALKALAKQVVKLLELRKAVYQLEMTQKDLVRVNQNLDEFAQIISHDIKAPLRNMKHLAEAIVEDYKDKLDEEGQEYLKMLNQTATDSILFVEGVLEYSKAIHYINSNQETLNLNELVASIIKQMECPSHVTISITEILPTVYASKIAFQQIFSNLISNAVKYNDKKEGWITINYLSEDEDNHIFQVADNGQGISRENLDSIFSLFYMVNKEDALHKGSCGIGLSIVTKLLSEMQGEVKVSSLLGKGSIFEFSIPKAEVK